MTYSWTWSWKTKSFSWCGGLRCIDLMTIVIMNIAPQFILHLLVQYVANREEDERITTVWSSPVALRKSTYLINVVLPTPGGPMTKMEPPPSTKSRMISALPETERPTRQVRPIICILRFRIALIRCKDLSMPDRLSSEKSPTYTTNQVPPKFNWSSPFKQPASTTLGIFL